eukprot:390930_1
MCEDKDYSSGLDHKYEILIYILFVSLSVGCGVSLLYFLRQFLKLSDLLVVQKRHFGLLKLESVISSIWLITQAPMYGISWSSFHDDGYITDAQINTIARVAGVWGPFLFHCVIIASLFRFYMLYFDAMYWNHLASIEWKIYIDEQIKDKRNWFVNNRKTYGDIDWVGKRIFIPLWIITTFPTTIYFGIFGYLCNPLVVLIDGLFYYFPIMITLIFYCKAPKLNTKEDCLFLISEMKAIVIIWCILLNIWVLSTFIIDAIVSQYVSSIFYFVLLMLVQYLPSAYCTFIVRRKILKSKYGASKQLTEMELLAIEVRDPVNINVAATSSASNENEITLIDTLCNKDWLDLFANYLIREYSVECIVCYIEFIQYKRFIKNQQNFHEESDSIVDRQMDYLVATNLLPKSNIIYDTEAKTLKDMVVICRKFYEKYIKTGSEMELNLPFRLRNRFVNLFEMDGENELQNELDNVEKLYHLFDDIIAEMFNIMNHSYGRFQFTKQFQQINNH